MSLRLLSACGLACTLLVAPAARAGDPTPEQRQQLGDFAWSKGAWSCIGQAYDVTSGTYKDAKSSFKVQPILDGTWLKGFVDEDKNDPNPYEGLYLVSYDTTWNKYVRYQATNKGGWGWASSSGYEGNEIVWTGKLQSFEGRADVNSRQTESHDGDKAFDLKLEFEGTDGAWHTLYSGHCDRG